MNGRGGEEEGVRRGLRAHERGGGHLFVAEEEPAVEALGLKGEQPGSDAEEREQRGDEALAVWTRPNEAWLLDLSGPCPDLEFTHAIGLTDNLGMVHARFDKVLASGLPRTG